MYKTKNVLQSLLRRNENNYGLPSLHLRLTAIHDVMDEVPLRASAYSGKGGSLAGAMERLILEMSPCDTDGSCLGVLEWHGGL